MKLHFWNPDIDEQLLKLPAATPKALKCKSQVNAGLDIGQRAMQGAKLRFSIPDVDVLL